MNRILPNKILLATLSLFFIPFLAWAQPTVTFTPANSATGIIETDNITIGFNQSVRRANDNANLSSTNVDGLITLKLTDTSGDPIDFDATINSGDDLITINPDASLPSGAVIYVAITNVENSSGTSISPATQSITFTVRDYVFAAPVFSPADAAVNVSITGDLTITFNEPIRKINDAALVDGDLVSPLLELKIGSDAGSAVPFSATIDAAKQVITINPSSDLLDNTIYYLEIGDVEDASNNAISPNPTSIIFSTPDTDPPTITFTPVNAAVDVNESNDITLAFSEKIRRASDNADLDNSMLASLVTLKLTNAAGADISFAATINAGDDLITINPSSALPSAAVIYVAITGVEDMGGNAITPATQSILFTVRDYAPPIPVFTPADAAVNVSVTGDLTITFNKPIRKINDAVIVDGDLVSPILELKVGNDAGTPVPFSATIDAAKEVITINPTSDLLANTIYYLEIGGVEDAADNAISPNPTSITFSTPDTNPPAITFTPLNAAVNVNENNDLTIAFSERVRRASDNADLDNGMLAALLTLKLTDASGANIPFTATINGGDDEITINPTAALASEAVIYVAITGVEDMSGNAITPATQSITFSVRDYLPPAPMFNPLNAATNVSLTGDLTITFNEPIRRLSDAVIVDGDLVSPLLELKVGNDGGVAVPFTATIDAAKQVITINPTSDLLNNTTYYLEIGAVEDDANNAIMPNPTSITFTTPDTNPANLTFTPLNAATGVNENNNITIAFSEPVRRASDDANLTDGMIAGLVTLKLTNAAGANIPFVGTINAGDDLITINPSSVLPSSAIIYVSITGVEDLSGNLIDPNPQSITFTVRDYQPPLIIFNPPNGTAGFSLAGNVIITFDEPVRKADGSVLSNSDIASLTLFRSDAIGGTPVPFSGSINAAKTEITLDPTSNLAVNKDYFVRLNTIEDIYGNESSQVTIQFKTVNLTVDAGLPRTICAGQTVTLGGSPTVVPSSGFYQITWSSIPAGFTSNSTNPLASPTITTTYTVTVVDTDGNTMTGDVTITVNPSTPASDLDIVFNPDKNGSYLNTDNYVNLSATLASVPLSTGIEFSGTGVNNFEKRFYPSAALGTHDITLTYTNSSGCTTSKVETVSVNNPSAYLSTLDPTYCENITTRNINILQPNGTTFNNIKLFDRATNTEVLQGDGWNSTYPNLTIRPEMLGAGKYEFRITYTGPFCLTIISFSPLTFGYVNCPNTYNLQFEILPKPAISINVDQPSYCSNAANPEILISTFTTGDILTVNGLSTGIESSGGRRFLNLDEASFDLNNPVTISYTHTNENGCINSTTRNVAIHPVPTASFAIPNGCVGKPVQATSVIDKGAYPSIVISNYFWNFGDGTNSTDPAVQKVYQKADDYNVTLSVTTDKFCTVTATQNSLKIGAIPDVNFTWANVCDGQKSEFNLASAYVTTNFAEVQSITWDFGDGHSVASGKTQTQEHEYNNIGEFMATARVESIYGCTNDSTKQVYKVTQITSVTGTNPYITNFNDLTDAKSIWISGGQNSSWEWGDPAKDQISTDASADGNRLAWVTNLTGSYNRNEQSWVHSPCFDLSALERPVISFDRRLITDTKDGVVLQINSKKSATGNTDWITVGTVGDGLNWYNKQFIEGAPGGQLTVGWEGSTPEDVAGWVTSTIALDDYLPNVPDDPATPTIREDIEARKNIRFRFAFGSNSDIPGPEGFAFDNFQINQRGRTVLVEQFTNSGSTNTSPTEPNKRSNAQVNQFLSLPKTTSEIVKIEYHLGLPGPNADALYTDNPQDANARAAYYGITSTPYTLMDAVSGSGQFFTNPGGWAPNQFSRISLQSAKVNINQIICSVGDYEKLNIEVRFEVLQDLPANTIFHVVAVERTINQTASNGENQFTYVMKKMIPNAAGTRYSTPLADGFMGIFNVEWLPKAYNFANLSFVVFAQNESTREIYQARFLETPQQMADPDLITGTEDPEYATRINIYPNPANDQVNIELPGAVVKPAPVTITDAFGRIVYESTFQSGEKNKTISTSAFADGMYMLQLAAPGGSKVVRKIMVTHK